jgi:hypothetical protein
MCPEHRRLTLERHPVRAGVALSLSLWFNLRKPPSRQNAFVELAVVVFDRRRADVRRLMQVRPAVDWLGH